MFYCVLYNVYKKYKIAFFYWSIFILLTVILKFELHLFCKFYLYRKIEQVQAKLLFFDINDNTIIHFVMHL